MAQEDYIAYVRVSTKHQIGNHSFDSQLDTIIKQMGHHPIKIYEEVASGRNDKRKVVTEALQYAKDNDIMFVTAYLDRFSRSVTLLTKVLDDGIKVKFLDFPNADELVLTIMAAIAKSVAVQTSEKVKAGLRIARKKGKKIGSPKNLTKEAMAKGRVARAKKAYDDGFAIGQLVLMLKEQGKSDVAVAQWLNKNGQRTRFGNKFRGSEVSRINYKYKVKYSDGFKQD